MRISQLTSRSLDCMHRGGLQMADLLHRSRRAGWGAQVAGAKSQSGLDVVDKAQSAVNLVKVIGALNQISDMLRARPATCMTSLCSQY